MSHSFSESGWAVLSGVVDRDRCRALERTFDHVMADQQGPGVWVRAAVLPLFADMLDHLHGRIARHVAAWLGATRLRVLQEALILKPPGAPEVPWHRDSSYLGYFDPLSVVSVRLALRDSSEASGCLAVLEGSHRWRDDEPMAIFDADQVDDQLSQLPETLRARASQCRRVLPLNAGDVSVHHCRTLHFSFPNLGPSPRKTIVTHLFDADARLVRERLPAAAPAQLFETDSRGRLVGRSFVPLRW